MTRLKLITLHVADIFWRETPKMAGGAHSLLTWAEILS